MHRPGRTIGLLDVLDLLEVPVPTWRVMALWAVAARSTAVDVAALERQVADAPDGVPMDGSGLRRVGAALGQVMECELLGFLDPTPHPTAREASVVVEAVDCAEWVVVLDEARVPYRDGGIATREEPMWGGTPPTGRP